MFGRTAIWLVLIVALATLGMAVPQELPEGEGKKLLEERCTSCGACVTICPSGAFEVEVTTRRVKFDNEKCLACELCIKACPPRAMKLHF